MAEKPSKGKVLSAAKAAKKKIIVRKRKKSVRTLYLDDENFERLQSQYQRKTSSVIDILIAELLNLSK